MIELVWGLSGALATCEPGDIAVIHDVLSFSTTVSLAVDQGIRVYPYHLGDVGARRFARTKQAELAGSRGSGNRITLSPKSFATLAEPPESVVLPSPNGATISASLAGSGVHLLTACLRNATATARYLNAVPSNAQASGRIVFVAAGERWADGTLRPALEDQLAAASVIAQLRGRPLSPDAELAKAAYLGWSGSIPALVAASPSGRELIESGFATDVDLACAVDTSSFVARYEPDDGCFIRG